MTAPASRLYGAATPKTDSYRRIYAMLNKIQLLQQGRIVDSGYCGYKRHPMNVREHVYNMDYDTTTFKVETSMTTDYYTVHNRTGVTELINKNYRRSR